MAEERDRLDILEVSESITLRNQERFTDHSETDTEILNELSTDPTQSELLDAIRDLQKRVANIQGVELATVHPPTD